MKVNKESCHFNLKKKLLIIFFDSGEIKASKSKLQLPKMCIHLCELHNFPIIKAISNGIDGDNNKYTFFNSIKIPI